MKSKTSHTTISFSKILENVIILALVTFLLGMAVTIAPRMKFTSKEAPRVEAGCSETTVIRTLNKSFVQPYAVAWRRLVPSFNMLLAKFDFSVRAPHMPTALYSAEHCLTAPCFP